MRTKWALIAGALVFLLSGVTDARQRPGKEPAPAAMIAPWKDISGIRFREFVALYAAGALENARTPSERDEIGEAILMSDATTYDEYVAAKETGVGDSELRAAALAAMEDEIPAVVGKKFMLRTSLDYYAYDRNAQGFPIYDRWHQTDAFTYSNPRRKQAAGSRDPGYFGVRPSSGLAPGFRFPSARISLSKLGWVIPASPEEARDKVQELGRTGGSRSIAAIIVFTINRCKPAKGSELSCSADVEAIYGYASEETALRTNLPLVELVERDLPDGWIVIPRD